MDDAEEIRRLLEEKEVVKNPSTGHCREDVTGGLSDARGEETMPQPLSADIKQLLDRPNFTHLATLMRDGSPQSAPVWVGREGDRILVCTGEPH